MEIRELEKTLASSRIDAQLKMEEGSSLDAMTALEAPMSSSLGAMGPVLRKLGSLPSPEYRLPKPLKDGIELLKEDLEDISAALVEQSMVDSPNQKSKYWMNEVRDLSYDIEEFIDNMMPSCRRQCQNETSPQLPSFLSTNRSQRVGRVKIARFPKIHKPSKWIFKMAELRNLVQEASERRHRYQLDDVCVSSSNHVLTGHGWVPELQGKADANYLVGMDDLRIKLVEWLTNEADQQLKVVPIVGYAGIGKTTLAKQVYHELGGRFECRAFVRASRKPDMRRLLGDILSQVQRCPRPSDSCTVQALTGNLTEHLQDKRYFIVIDDLWETTRWDIVKRAFPEGNNCSRIITTAEIEGVALKCCGHQSDHIFRVKPLDNHDSGKLFFSIAFGCEHGCPDHLKEISNRIIRRCGGLPLATICIAGLLATQPGNFELWYHVQECLGLSTNPNLEETLKQALNLSYNNLPHYLRTCLLYLSMYPEGYTMWKVDLLKQWISECFITSTEEKDSEEVANSYFGELVSMGLIQPVQVNNNDEVLSCTMHHTVLDFIIFKSKEENFITAIDYSRTIAGFSSMVRRLSLHYSSAKYATKLAAVSLSQVRSLVFFGLLRCLPSLVEFKLLRVLVLEFWGDQYGHMSLDLTRICVLFLLRYLKISCDITVELPAQMRGLQYLETLEINARVLSVPLDIIHLPVLLHLSLPIEANLSDGIGRITSLVTLQNFDLGSNSEKNVWSLAELMNLQNLHLTCSTVKSHEYLKRNLAALSSSIGKLVNLKSLTLAPGALDIAIYHDDSSSLSSPTVLLQRLELLSSICIFSRLPEWIRQLRKLCILKVTVGELPTKDIDMLTGLPVLTVLSLHVRRPTAENIIFGKGAFPVLNYFKYRCGVLRLAFQEGAMPNLRWLKLGFNAHRGEQYDGHLLAGVEHLLSLEEIAGITGAAPGAEEPDRRAAESALKDSIRKHPRFSSSYDNNVTRVDWVAEEYEPRIQLEGASNEHHEIVPKQSGSEKEDSSNEQPSITMENKEQCDNSRISHFPTPGSNFSFLDRTKSGAEKVGAKGSASMTELSVLRGACGNVMSFTFRELVAATRNFREECYIGEGRYGRVYKGRLESAGKVAIKKLNMDGKQGNKEFLEAVGMLSSLHHQNLVNLVGYCVDGDKRLLVYEYMPLGSLEDHLHDLPPKKEPLDWNTRMKIAAGAASGLEYLHDRAELRPVIYKDFKSSKILLDEGFHPKLSKLSLAKLGPVGYMSHFSTRAMAARGYCAPEYATTGKLTVATGVFSFGVVLLELITGRRAIDSTRPHEEQILVTWAWPLLKERRNLPKMADPGLKGRYPMPELYKALEVAAMCIQPEATSRPPIADIVPTLSYLASQTYNPSATHASEKAGGDGRSRRRAVLKNDEAGSSSHKSDRGDSPRLPGKLKRMVAETKKWSANLLEAETKKWSANLLEKTRVATSAQGNLDSPAKTG